jgi:hypothetical protein
MRESRTYGSVRGARDETRVPTATGRGCRFLAIFDVRPGAVILPRSEAKPTWRGLSWNVRLQPRHASLNRRRPAQQLRQLGEVFTDIRRASSGARCAGGLR